MKKTILLMITILILLSGCATKQDDESIFIHKEMKYLDNWKMSEEEAAKWQSKRNQYSLFMYIEGDPFRSMGGKYFDDHFGPADYQDGYLYVKDNHADIVYQLSTQPVEDVEVDLNLFACNHEIFKLSDDFTECESIYKGSGKINFCVYDTQNDKNYKYFVDGDKLIKFNLSDYSYQVLTEKCYGDRFCVKKDIAVLCYIYNVDENGEVDKISGVTYVINIKEGYRRAILNPFECTLFEFGEDFADIYEEDFVGQETEFTYQKYEKPDYGDTSK
ncbi:MAG: hypothetical protein ACI4WG_03460 [Erysipelotrichaceae bacterium]